MKTLLYHLTDTVGSIDETLPLKECMKVIANVPILETDELEEGFAFTLVPVFITTKKHTTMDIIIHEVSALPETADPTAWYFYANEYYFLSNETGAWVNKGGDRPTKPPVNP